MISTVMLPAYNCVVVFMFQQRGFDAVNNINDLGVLGRIMLVSGDFCGLVV